MKDLDVAMRALFAAASAVRHARIFHPHGVVAQGHGELDSPWWPVQGRVPVTARLSRGIGLPAAVPDILGLALRFHLPSGPWDVLLATSTPFFPVFLWPARSWSSAHYSSITAYRTDEDRALRWVRAEPEPGQPTTGTLAALARSGTLQFGLSLVSPYGVARPAGRVTLEPLRDRNSPQDDGAAGWLAFDPVLHRPSCVVMWPQWIAATRESAYRGSRAGRHATSETSAETGPDHEPGPTA